jgi:hypothetical protein
MKLNKNYSLLAYGSAEDYIFCKEDDDGVTCVELMPTELAGKGEGGFIGARRDYGKIAPGEAFSDMEQGGFSDDEIKEYDDFRSAFYDRIAADR